MYDKAESFYDKYKLYPLLYCHNHIPVTLGLEYSRYKYYFFQMFIYKKVYLVIWGKEYLRALVSSMLYLEKNFMLYLGFTNKTNIPSEFQGTLLSLKHLHSHVTISSQ